MAMPPLPAPASFTPRRDDSLRATAAYIMEQAIDDPDVVLLDVRSDAEWLGLNDRGNKRAGRIPGAVHLEWLNNVTPDEERRLKPAEALRAQFEAIGVTPDKEIVTYCQGGIRAAQAAMTLRLLGYERVRNYDGSFFEWANRDDTPLVQ
jgi:thiosulfate/3-mercaptopyruvate sulfurtransferase